MSIDHDKGRPHLNTLAFQVQVKCVGTNTKAGIDPSLSCAPGFNRTTLMVVSTAFVVRPYHEVNIKLVLTSSPNGSISARKYLYSAIVSSLFMRIAVCLCCSRTASRPLYDASIMRVSYIDFPL